MGDTDESPPAEGFVFLGVAFFLASPHEVTALSLSPVDSSPVPELRLALLVLYRFLSCKMASKRNPTSSVATKFGCGAEELFSMIGKAC